MPRYSMPRLGLPASKEFFFSFSLNRVLKSEAEQVRQCIGICTKQIKTYI